MSDAALTQKRVYFLEDGAQVADARSISIARIVVAPLCAAWQAAVDNLERCKAVVEAAGTAHKRAEAEYLKSRPAPPLVEDVFTPSPSSADEMETRVAASDDDYKRLIERLRQETGFAEAQTVWETACTEEASAADALLLCPAPDIAAVAHKIEVAKSQGMELVDIEPVLIDLHRLASKT